MEQPLYEIFLWNDTYVSTRESESLRPIQDNAIYEVLRMEDGVPLFFAPHFHRLLFSAERVGRPLPYGEKTVLHQLWALKEMNGFTDSNIKMLWAESGGQSHFVVYAAPGRELEDEDRQIGCKTSLYALERKNPNVKLQKDAYREKTAAVIREREVFELLLTDDTGCVREGSRANLFLIKEGVLYTAPAASVLMGITRMQVLKAIRERGYELKEELLHTEDLERIEAAFLTGTSIDVLPIRSIDDMPLASAEHPIVQTLKQDYLHLVEKDKKDFHW